jgi:hypothetical protein
MSVNDFVNVVFSAIARQEGEFSEDPNVVPRRNNNPLDLRYAGQIGARRPAGSKPPENNQPEPIAVFDTLEHGIAAGYRQLWLDIARGMSLRELVYAWAPKTENDTTDYFANVQKWSEFNDEDANAPLLRFLLLKEKVPTS